MTKKVAYQGYFTLELVDTPSGVHEVLRATNSVSILLYDGKRNRLILVRQPRVSMATDDNPEGMITELVAGRFDGTYTPKQLVVKEVLEETGVLIRESDVVLLNDGKPMAVSAGSTDERSYLAFAEIVDHSKHIEGMLYGAEGEGERITRIHLSGAEAEAYLNGQCEDVRVYALITYFLRWYDQRFSR